MVDSSFDTNTTCISYPNIGCSCPIDWVGCMNQFCPRLVAAKAQLQSNHMEWLRLNDPRVRIIVPILK